MPAVLFFKSWIRNFVQHVLWKCTLPKLWGASYFSRINVSYEHRFTTTSNVKIHLWEMKIGFGKIWMIRTCRLHEISWEGNKPKRNKKKKRYWMEYIKNTYRQSKCLFLSEMSIWRTACGAEPSWWKRDTCSRKIKHDTKCGKQNTRHSFKSLVKHFLLFQTLTDILTFSVFVFTKVLFFYYFFNISFHQWTFPMQLQSTLYSSVFVA